MFVFNTWDAHLEAWITFPCLVLCTLQNLSVAIAYLGQAVAVATGSRSCTIWDSQTTSQTFRSEAPDVGAATPMQYSPQGGLGPECLTQDPRVAH